MLAHRIEDSDMAKSKWTPFAHADKSYDYAGDKLAKAWKALHAGDLEPFPDEKHVAKLLNVNPLLSKSAGGKDAAKSRRNCRMPGAHSILAISSKVSRPALR